MTASEPLDVDKLQKENLRPLWLAPVNTVTRQTPGEPLRRAVATIWRYQTVRQSLLEMGAAIPVEEAERRLCNEAAHEAGVRGRDDRVVGPGEEGDLDFRLHRQIRRCRCACPAPCHNSKAWAAKAADTGLTKGNHSRLVRPNQYPPSMRGSLSAA